MKTIDNILNKIGEFDCIVSGKPIHIIGILSRNSEEVYLNGRVYSKVKIKDIYDNNPLYIWGNIDNVPVTFLNGYIIKSTMTPSSEYFSFVIEPSEIIIGYSFSSNYNNIKATQISASITDLNNMFTSAGLFECFCNSYIDNPVIKNHTDSEPITANDKFGQLQIYQQIISECSDSKITHSLIPVIEYDFKEPVEIMEALTRIASVRNLFSFFANHYLPLENIVFSCEESQNEDLPVYSKAILHLNHNENIIIHERPFLIKTNAFNNDFQLIWEKWLHLYEKSRPIVSMFYEVICYHSVGINRFLNLSQAIEVYSCRYREPHAQEVKSRYDEKKVRLFHRITDILEMINTSINLNNDDIKSMAEALSDMRNFFTHYNEERYIEPTYKELSAACSILNLVLLDIIYFSLDLSDEYIKDCTKNIYFSNMDMNYKIVLGYHNKKSNR